MKHLKKSEFRALLRSDPYAFMQRAFYELNPTATFLHNWHIEQIVAKLEACRRGKIRRLIITVPPRSLKSICASVAFPAWLLAMDPTAKIMCVSYAQDLSDKHARDCRTVMMSNWYQERFATRLSPDRNAVDEFLTTEQGYRLSRSITGVLTGRGADYIIIDDPLKPDEALSEVQRKAVNEAFSHTLYSRLNDKATGCIIVIMQRLHEDDLVGHLIQQGGWEVLSFPAIAEQDETITIETIHGRRIVERKIGDVLHPERESAVELDRIRTTMGEWHFAGQYQQNPAPRGGGMVQATWFRRYDEKDLPESFDRIIQSWDTANKPTDLSDYSVCTTWGLKDNRYYLLNVFRKRRDYPSLKRAVKEQHDIYKPSTILIEDKASGTQLIQELREDGVHVVTAYKSKFDKVMRFDAQTGVIENGLVYIPNQAHWLDEYLHELTTFPKSRFDDQVDSTSQALEWLKQRFSGWGIFEYYGRLAAEAGKSNETKTVCLKAPPGISHVGTLTGQMLMVRGDGTVEVSEEDARYLAACGFTRV